VKGQSVILPLPFESYKTLADCFTDHAWLLSHGAPYIASFAEFQKSHNFDAYVMAIASKYASEPTYGKVIDAFADGTTVQWAIQQARAQPLLQAA